MAKVLATQATLDFTLGDPGKMIIDIPRCLSLCNRKSFRSGYVYSVDYMEYIGTAGDVISVHQIPCTYVSMKAYDLGFRIWRKQRAEVLEETEGNISGRWSDFKPYYSQAHEDGTFAEVLPMGVSAAGAFNSAFSTANSEWNRATIVINDISAATTDNIEVGMLGADDLPNWYGSLCQAWVTTRSGVLNPDPMVPAAASSEWIARTGEASGEMSYEVINVVEAENDRPPYANEPDVVNTPIINGGELSVPGGVLMDTSTTGSTGRAVSLNGGLVPLGLIQLATAGQGAGIFRIHLTRGSYKGIAALPCGDFR